MIKIVTVHLISLSSSLHTSPTAHDVEADDRIIALKHDLFSELGLYIVSESCAGDPLKASVVLVAK